MQSSRDTSKPNEEKSLHGSGLKIFTHAGLNLPGRTSDSVYVSLFSSRIGITQVALVSADLGLLGFLRFSSLPRRIELNCYCILTKPVSALSSATSNLHARARQTVRYFFKGSLLMPLTLVGIGGRVNSELQCRQFARLHLGQPTD